MVAVHLPVGWLVVPALLLLLVLVAVTFRLGVRVTYDAAGFRVQVRVGPRFVQVFPLVRDPDKEAKKRRKKEANAAKKQARAEKKRARAARKQGKPPTPPEPKKPNLGGLLSLVWDLLPVVQEVLSRFRHKLRVDELTLHLTWAEEDPADTGIHYGCGWAVLETLLAFLEANVTIHHRDVALHVDFLAEKPRVFLQAGLSLTLAQLLALGLWAATRAGKILLPRLLTKKRKPPATEKTTQKSPPPDGGAVNAKR